jgi:hypothetical protein
MIAEPDPGDRAVPVAHARLPADRTFVPQAACQNGVLSGSGFSTLTK